ncbi:MAG: aminotransferase class V-fold PLP-dependent enzyme, partial [Longimicrobiales bacterium]|nr:aminotransferase class V-fold PLP-dependent enzyme [Longimicrobiales bacterium]
ASMEAAIVNLFNRGDTVVACCNGRFGEMWAGFAETYGLHVVRVATDWARSVDPEEVEGALAELPGARGVTIAHCDTSTGVLNPVAAVAAAARRHGALALVDAISSLGGAPFAFDAWDVDVAVTSSQKCLMSSPGISFVALSARAWAAAEAGTMPRAYLDFAAIRDTLAGPRPQTPGTTPVLLALQVLEAVRMIHEEGLETVFARHRLLSDTVTSWAAARGIALQGEGIVERSPTLTALRMPDGVDPARVRAAARAEGIQIAAGLGDSKATCVRIGHMGDIRAEDVSSTLGVLDSALAAEGR